jgi:LysR family cys regulon transcriptional activator
MNIQQLRYAAAITRHGLNVSEAANALHTSQPGVSKQIRALEAELGVELFVRQGRRFVAVTDAGREVLAAIGRILEGIANLKAIGAEHAAHAKGALAVAVTHTQARYALPAVVTRFKKAYPEVKLKLLQGNPHQLARMVVNGEADLAIATEALDEYGELVALPGYQWHHCVVVPEGHELRKVKPLTLEAIARFPLVTYDPTFAGRGAIDRAFAARGLAPEVALSALDSDVIKSYVSLGLGVGIISQRAFRAGKEEGLAAIDSSHLFPAQTTRIAYRRGAYLRAYAIEFIRMIAPGLLPADIARVEAGAGSDFAI